MVAMHGGNNLTERRRQDCGERDGERLNHGDVQAASAARGSDLEADEPCAHDRYTRRVRQLPPERDRVVQTAQDEYACAWRDAGQGSGARTGCDNEPVVVGTGAIGKGDAPRTKVDRRRAHTEPHVERERAVSILPVEKSLLRVPGALEHLLRERRAVVGAMWLVADDGQLTVEAAGAQRLGRAETRQRGANDHDSAQHRSRSLFDRNRSRWTLAHGLVHFRAQTWVGRLVQDVQFAVVADLEHLWRRLHAEPVEIA